MEENEKLLKLLSILSLRKWGHDHQIKKCREESSELLLELCRYDTGRAEPEQILEEAADAIITINHIVNIFGPDEFQKVLNRKLIRLERLVTE